MKTYITILFCTISLALSSQSVGIGTDTPHSSAALDITSSDQGILIPRGDTAAIASPAVGLMIFQNADSRFYYHDGSKWLAMGMQSDKLEDSDGDTKILVEATPDDDEIKFFSAGTEVMTHDGQALQMKNNGQSVFIGEQAGSQDDFSENKNVFVGYRTGESNTTGTHNNAIGNQSLNQNTTGSNNTSIGQQALFKSNGSNNVAIGLNAAKENTTGSKNISIGNFANFSNQSGVDNVVIGDEAGRATTAVNTSGNVLMGSRAGNNTETSGNVAIGRDALHTNVYGANNVAVGDSALSLGTGATLLGFGSNNVAIGANAGKNTNAGRQNTFVGGNAAQSNSNGNFNSVMGYNAAGQLISGSHNTINGFSSGLKLSTGANNTMVGSEAGYNNTQGTDNVLIGRRAGYVNTEGEGNINIGTEAGLENRTGNNNIYIGKQAGRNVIGGDGNIYIGNEAGKDRSSNNLLIVENGSNSIPLIVGQMDSLKTTINGQLIINDPDSTGYALPDTDGGFGSLLRSDGNGSAYWFNALSTTASTAPPTGGNAGGIDDSSDDGENYLAAPCIDYEYFFDIQGIPGEATNIDHADEINGYGWDFSYAGASYNDCINMNVSIRKAVDKASPKLFLRAIGGATIPEINLYQTLDFGTNTKNIVKIKLTNAKVANLRHETYQRGTGKYSTYEVVKLSFETITMTYYVYDTGGQQVSTEEMTFNCQNPF